MKMKLVFMIVNLCKNLKSNNLLEVAEVQVCAFLQVTKEYIT